jgi:hypothetical protein
VGKQWLRSLWGDGEWEGDDFLLIEPGEHLQIDMAHCRLYAG